MNRIKLLLISVVAIFFVIHRGAYAQVPQGFNYQAVARGSDGKEIPNTTLQVKISVLSDTTGFYLSGMGNYVWEEQQSVKTNSLGLFSLVLGNPAAIKIQGTASSFSTIDWKAQPLFIGTKIYYQSTWRMMGSAKLWSVPYAMVSGDLAGPVQKLSIGGSTSVMDDALFEVRNRTGQTVFAVYNEGVRIYVDDGIAKGQGKGGFAIGSFGTAKASSQPYFVVDPDSIRAYIDNNPVKALKGGFAIGGFDKAKAINQEFLNISNDSIRFYINDAPGKATKGGFAIGGFDKAKGQPYEYLRVTSDSSRLYVRDSLSNGFAVKNIQNGKFEDLMKLRHRNYFIGYKSGFNTTPEFKDNIFIGSESGFSNTTGQSNLFLGHSSGYFLINGNNNLFLGNRASWMSSDGYNNICIGSYSGGSNGSDNIYLGNSIGGFLHNGNLNVSIGSNSGKYITGSRELVIHSDFLDFPSSNVPLIYGRFDLMHLKFNGDVLVSGKESFAGSSLQVIGDAGKGSILISPNQDDQSTSNSELILAEETGATYRMGIQYNGSANQLRIYGGYANIVYGPHLSINRNDGNVGIGTISPAVKLHVIGNEIIQGNIGIGTAIPVTKLDIGGGNNWDLINGEGDLRIGDGTHRLKIGVALGGGGAGAVGIMQYGHAGGYNVLSIGAQGNYLLFLNGGSQNVGIGTDSPGYKLTVNGTAWCSSGSWTGSDIRWKKNIKTLDNSLQGILNLQGVNYDLRSDEFPEMGFETGSQVGLVAQDVEKIFPQLVNTDNNGYKAVAYDKLSVLLVEGMKEQQRQMETYKSENENLRSKLESLQEKVDQIEAMLAGSVLK